MICIVGLLPLLQIQQTVGVKIDRAISIGNDTGTAFFGTHSSDISLGSHSSGKPSTCPTL
jgi:hypothetical protein